MALLASIHFLSQTQRCCLQRRVLALLCKEWLQFRRCACADQTVLGNFVHCIIMSGCFFVQPGNKLFCWDSALVKTDAQLTVRALE